MMSVHCAGQIWLGPARAGKQTRPAAVCGEFCGADLQLIQNELTAGPVSKCAVAGEEQGIGCHLNKKIQGTLFDMKLCWFDCDAYRVCMAGFI